MQEPKLRVVTPTTTDRKVRFVQMHDAFAPLQMGSHSATTLSTEGAKAMEELVETEKGVLVRHKTREFLVPYANISFFEYDTNTQK